MKKLVAATAVATLIASSAFAGGKNNAEMEPMVETEEVMAAANGSAPWIVPLLALALLGVAAGSGTN